jgi:hypothetical protein
MNIYFTRHSRQRLKLYKIDKADVIELLTSQEADKEPVGKRKEFVADDFVVKYGFPLKVAFVNEATRVVLITVFRFDKETKYEDIVR